jgi:O-succinylbenzoate synthase
MAKREGIDAFVGGMLETSVGRAVAHAVAAQAPCTLPTDAGPSSRYFTDDIGPAFEVNEAGRLVAPASPGIGLAPDQDALDRWCVDRVWIDA